MRAFAAALALCLVAALSGTPLSGATYYVATNGNDGWPGSSGQPWATLQHAVDTITAGDTVIVRSGNFAGFRKVNLSGTSGAPITIKSETPLGANINTRGPQAGHGSMFELEGSGQNVSYWVIDGFAIDGTVQTAGYGTDVRLTDHITIKNCNVHNAFKTGLFSAFSDYIEEISNTTHNNGEHGIYNSNSGDNGHTTLTTSYSNAGNGLQNNADASMGGDGVMSYWLHERNTFYSNMNGYNFDGLCQSTIRNSLVYNNTSKGFSLYGGDAGVSANGDKILNNTVIGPSGGYYDIIVNDNGKAVLPLGHRLFNNILYHYNNVQGRGSICIATACLADFQSDYNVVMDWFGFNDNGSQENLAAWRSRGFDVHSIQAADTALFVNPGANDYHLLSTSPARDAGTAQTAVGEDIAGMSRPQNSTYDIGCYEYVSEGMHSYAITTSSLPTAAVAVEYSQALAATGGTIPYRWSLSSGSLPSGLVLNPITGIAYGTPTTAGTSNFTMLLTDAASSTASKALSLTVNTAALQITTQSVPNGVLSAAYSTTLQATGGSTPYSWSLNAGSLPAGLSLTSGGVISGTPSATGTSNFTAKVTDNQSSTATRAYSIVVSVSLATLQDGLSGYSGTRDTWLNSDYGDTNYGTSDTSHLQYGTPDRQLHKFDVSSIPVGSTINNATISFYCSSLSGGTPAVACHRILTHWDELQATYNSRVTGTAWGTPGLLSGTDYDATALATTTVTTTGWVSFNITSAVQGWVNGSYANEGVMYRETSSGHCVTRMREFGTDPSLRPKLSVSFAPGSGLVITTGSLPADTVNIAYNQTLHANGGATPYTWSLQSGSLPTGLSLVASTGVISGTPSATGTSSFTARVTDNGGLTATQALSIVINPAPSITTSSLPNGTVGASYNQTLAVSGGTTPFTWSLQSGSLPAGLSLVASSGAITGTPTTYGTSNFTARVTDNVSASATRALSIIVSPAALRITTVAVPNAALSVAYSSTLQATGGVTPYTWALASGSVPAGLSLTSGGVISGTPTATGTSSFTARVTDNLSTTATRALAIVVSPSQVILQDGLNGYTGTSDTWLNSDYPTTNYGTGDMNHLQYNTPDRQLHKFDLSSIPSGATVNAAQIWFDVQNVTGGTPAVGCYRVLTHWDEMQATWNNRLTGSAWGAGGLQSGTDYVATALGTVTVSSTGWVAYDITSAVQGWVNGSYANEGVMYMETTPGMLMVYMSDYADPTTVRPKLIVNYTSTGPSITTSSLPADTMGVAYNQTLTATGGVTPYTWAVLSGSLPSGLSLVTSTGAITGTPTVSGTSNFTARVTDNAAATATKALSIVINAAPSITTSSLAGGTVNTPYSQTLAASGGTTPYAWAISSGTLPAGLSLGSSTGAITGTPTASGTSNFTARVTDNVGATATRALSIIVTGGGSQHTYYISTTGNDTTGDGSSGNPWATIQKGVDTAVAGDTVIVRPGNYTGFSGSGKTGTPGAPITIKSETAGAANINVVSGRVSHGSMIEFEPGSYCVIDGFSVDGTVQTAGYDIDLRGSDHITVKNCTLTHGWLTGLFTAFTDYADEQNNVTHDNREHGIYNSNSGDYGYTKGNISYANAGNGAQNNSDASMGGDGIMTNWLHERNTFYNNMNGYNFDGLSYSTVRNSLIYGNTSKGFSMYGGDAAVSAHDNRILNNTVVMPANSYYAMFIGDTGKPVTPTGHRLFNNVFYNYGPSGSICIPTSARTDFQSDYNAVVDKFGLDDDATIYTFTQWKALGYDTHSIQAADTALFVNPGANDYHLKSTSPARDAGTALADVTEDFTGMSRPQNSVYDIGCYEYVVEGMHPLSVATMSLPDCAINEAYYQTLQASGGMTPYTWAIISGSLPSGFSLNSDSGSISGTGATPATSNFTVRVTDSQTTPATATKALSITVTNTTMVVFQEDLDGYAGTRDTWITEDYPTSNFGGSDIDHLQYPTQDRQLRKFDISSIPANSTVNSATVSLYVFDLVSGTPSLNCYRVITHWDEMQATYNNRITGTAWGAPGLSSGTDFAATALGTTTVTSAGWVTFDITSTVQGWVSGSYANEGVMYKLLTDGWARTYSREMGPPEGGWGHPMLTVTYTPGGSLSITTSALPADTVGLAYNQTLAATGGTTPYTWAISSGSLPAGLSLVAGTGAITGTPTTSGTSNFTARVTDNVAATATKALSIAVNAAVTITTASLPADTVNVSYNQTLAATGGTGALTWAISSGTLPTGLSLNASTGAITGTPTASGTSSFTARATDTLGATGTKALSIVVNSALSITTSSLPADTVGVAYNQTLARTGGTTPFTWSISSGSLPAGLSLVASTGTITGTPTTSGTSSFTARVTDNVGATATRALSIVTNAAVTITTASLPADTINVAYSQTLSATGGTGALTWAISSGSLPTGLSLVAGTGAITGTPTATGTSSFTARATDTVGATGTKALSIVVNAAVSITTSSLPADTINVAYSQTLAATGGTTPLTWSLASGTLPTGLSLVAGTGAITGTPTASGTSSFTARVTDSVGATATKALSIVVNAAPSITTSSLPNGNVGIAYNQTLASTGGTSPITWSLSSGSLPSGLSLVASTGAITGTPTASGTSNFTARVTDNVGATATKALSIVVTSTLTITTSSLPATTVGATYNQTLAATGGATPYTWSLASGSLPAGLSLVAGTGAITGTPTTSGTSSFTARVTDNVSATATKALSIAVSAAVTITTASLPADTISVAYNQTLTATGGTGALTWSISSGTLPTGLSLNSSTGAVTGTPTASGTASFTARATDTVNATGTKALSIVVNAAPSITTTSLPAGAVGTSYNQTLASTGGTVPLTWSLASGSLPAGLSLVASTGVISGTPTATGTSSFTARVTDNVAATATKALSIVISAGGPYTYYVATTGNDTTGDGSSGNPWATIQKGVDTAANGDTILVTNGNYAGFRVRYSGTSGAVKTVRAQNPLGAVITSAGTQCTTPSYIEVKNDTPANGVSYWVIDGFETTGSANYSIEVQYGDHVTVQNCKLHNSSANTFRMSFSNYCAVQNNEMYSPTAGSLMFMGNSGDNNTIAGNNLHNGPSAGVFVQSEVVSGDQICSGWLIEKNSCYTLLKAITIDGVQASTIRNNLGYGLTQMSMYMLGASALTTCNNDRVLNNTFLTAAAGYYCLFLHRATAGIPEGTNNNLFNNIFYSYASGTSGGSITIDTAARTGFQSDYNVVMNVFGLDDNATTYDLTGWRGLGYDAHSIQAADTALFVTPGSDFHLKAGSPAINAGTTLADCTSDKEGVSRPQGGAYDIGCYEVVPGAEPTYQSAASDGEATTTSTAWQTKTTLSFTPGVSDDWAILGFAEHKGSSASYSVRLRMQVDGVTEGEITVEPKASTDYQSFRAAKVVTLSAAAHTITLQYSSENASATAYIRNARVVALRKASLVMSSGASDSSQNLTTTLTNYATVSFTPATAGDYLLIANAEAYGNSTSYSTQVQAKLGSTVLDACLVEAKDTTDWWTFGSFSVVNCPASAQTLAIAAAKETGSSATHSIRKARVMAIRLSESRFAGYQSAASDGESTTTSTAFQEKLTKSWSVSTAGNWLLLSSFRVANSSASRNTEGRVQLDDATTSAQPLRQPQDTTDYMNDGSVDVRNLSTGTRRLDIDYRSSNSAGTAKIKYAHVVALPL